MPDRCSLEGRSGIRTRRRHSVHRMEMTLIRAEAMVLAKGAHWPGSSGDELLAGNRRVVFQVELEIEQGRVAFEGAAIGASKAERRRNAQVAQLDAAVDPKVGVVVPMGAVAITADKTPVDMGRHKPRPEKTEPGALMKC